eukprot:1948082-Prymnesium_polylepis.2
MSWRMRGETRPACCGSDGRSTDGRSPGRRHSSTHESAPPSASCACAAAVSRTAAESVDTCCSSTSVR